MSLLRNKIGRPSNDFIKKRKLIYIVIILISVAIFTGTGLLVSNYFRYSRIDALSKNAVTLKVRKKIYSTKSQATVTTKNKATVINGCPKNYVHYGTNTCIKKTTPIKQDVSLTLQYTLKNNQSWNKAAPSRKVLEQIAQINCNNKGYRYAKNVKYSFNSNVWEKRVYTVTATCSELTSKHYVSSTKITVPYYNQKDYYSIASACGGGNLSAKGCLPTSGAMIFSALTGKTITPKTMNSYADSLLGNCSGTCYKKAESGQNVQICDGNSYYVDFLKVYASNNGKIFKENVRTASVIDAAVKTGKCVGVAPLDVRRKCTSSVSSLCDSRVGHFVIFAANQTNGYVTVKDPLNVSRANVKVPAADLIKSTQSDKVVLFCNSGGISNPSSKLKVKTSK